MLYKIDPDIIAKNHATLACYVLKGNYHPVWNHWSISICHLREQLGLQQPQRQFQSATHEILIVAYTDVVMKIDKDKVVSFDGVLLKPFDLCHHIEAPDDETAVKIFEKFINKFRAWETSPDQDYYQHNRRLINQLVASC